MGNNKSQLHLDTQTKYKDIRFSPLKSNQTHLVKPYLSPIISNMATRSVSTSAYASRSDCGIPYTLQNFQAHQASQKNIIISSATRPTQTAITFLYNHNRSNPTSPVYNPNPTTSHDTFETFESSGVDYVDTKPVPTQTTWQPVSHETTYTYGSKSNHTTASNSKNLSKWDKYIKKINDFMSKELSNFCLTEKNNVSFTYESNVSDERKETFKFEFRFKGVKHRQWCEVHSLRNGKLVWCATEKTPKRIYYALKEYIDDVYYTGSVNIYDYTDF